MIPKYLSHSRLLYLDNPCADDYKIAAEALFDEGAAGCFEFICVNMYTRRLKDFRLSLPAALAPGLQPIVVAPETLAAMAAISPGERPPAQGAVYTQGLVAFVNMYLTKTIPTSYLEDFVTEELMQAYIIVSDKQVLDTDNSGWDMPSKTLGVVLAVCECKPGKHVACAQFPKLRAKQVAMHVVEDARIPAAFADLQFKCLSKWPCQNSTMLYERLLECTRLLKDKNKGNRPLVRMLGRATGELYRFLGRPGVPQSEDTQSGGCEADVVSDVRSGVALMRLPRQRVSDAMAGSSDDVLWQDASAWIVGRSGKSTVHESGPGVLGEGVCIQDLASLCRKLLKDCVWESIAAGPVVDLIACKHVAPKSAPRSAKARRVQERQSILILNIDYSSPPAFAQTSLKYNLVWLMPYWRLMRLLGQKSRDIFGAGSLHVVEGQSPDSRRLRISPALPEEDVVVDSAELLQGCSGRRGYEKKRKRPEKDESAKSADGVLRASRSPPPTHRGTYAYSSTVCTATCSCTNASRLRPRSLRGYRRMDTRWISIKCCLRVWAAMRRPAFRNILHCAGGWATGVWTRSNTLLSRGPWLPFSVRSGTAVLCWIFVARSYELSGEIASTSRGNRCGFCRV